MGVLVLALTQSWHARADGTAARVTATAGRAGDEPLPYIVARCLRVQGAGVEQVFGGEFAGGEGLLVGVVEHLVDFGAGAAEAPAVEVGAASGLLLFPEAAIPERGLVDALPLEPLVAALLRLLPGVEQA